MITQVNLENLKQVEQEALLEFSQLLRTRFDDLIRAVILFGSKARGDDTPESDIDVLVVVASDDWQLHKQISYLATEIGLKYNLLELSPRIWSVAHLEQMAAIQASLYRNIQRDGINLLQTSAQSPGNSAK